MSRAKRARPERPARSGAASFARELVIVVVGALIISSLLRAFVGQMFLIPSSSMEHTLEIGDRVAVTKIGSVHRGQVVVFADPGGWLDPLGADPPSTWDRALQFVGFPVDAGTSHLIKRVIGMPGDHVVCCDRQDRITVNGQALDESSYLYRDGDAVVRPSDYPFDVVVPAGHLWVMGDHRNDSADSRCHLDEAAAGQGPGSAAFVPESDVVGPAFAVAFPVGRATVLHVPATFDAVPAATGSPPAAAVTKGRPPPC